RRLSGMGTTHGPPRGLLRWGLVASAAAAVIAGAVLLLHDSAPVEAPPIAGPSDDDAVVAPPLPAPIPELHQPAPVALLPEVGAEVAPEAETTRGAGLELLPQGMQRHLDAVVVATDGTPVEGASIEAFVTEEFDPSELI